MPLGNDTVARGFATRGLKLENVHKYSGEAANFTTAFLTMTVDKTEWPTNLQSLSMGTLFMKSDQILTFRQKGSTEANEKATFAADAYVEVPVSDEGELPEVKAAAETAVEYYFLIA